MKPDLYTKAVLTIIAALLAIMVINQCFFPSVSAFAQPPQRVIIAGVDTKNARLPVEMPMPVVVAGAEGKPLSVVLTGGSQAVPVRIVNLENFKK